MASAVEPTSPFHRRSPSNAKRLANRVQKQTTTTGGVPQAQRYFNLKSLPSLPAFDVPAADFDFDSDFRVSLRLARDVDRARLAELEDKPAPYSTLDPRASNNSCPKPLADDRSTLWLVTSKSTPDFRESIVECHSPHSPESDGPVSREKTTTRMAKPVEKPRTFESFTGFARRPWRSRSRSPSPAGEPLGAKREKMASNRRPSDKVSSDTSPRPPTRRGGTGRNLMGSLGREGNMSSDSLGSTKGALSRAGTYFNKLTQRPKTPLTKSASAAALSSSLYGSSRTALPSPNHAETSFIVSSGSNLSLADPSGASLQPRHRDSSQTTSSSASDTGTSSENTSQATADTILTMPPISHDPLGATFRNLEADYVRFAGAATGKMPIVRASVIPFLVNTANHASNSDQTLLTPEDIERRTTILSKWWNGLLEMLDGSVSRLGYTIAASGSANASAGAQPIAGVDRPALLEATAMIMMRPEWRLLTSSFQPLADRLPSERVSTRSKMQSAGGGASSQDLVGLKLLAESAEHTVRTTFVNNLLLQMTIVVDKMSMRHAPMSLVNWSGKACAYAFFFVPGVADILVRLWNLKPDLIRRVADEFQLPRRSKGESEDIVALFPPNLGGLGWTSVMTMTNRLRVATQLPLLHSQIHWQGPWVSRWSGGDTDLFFIFCKYYYILAEEFMPTELPMLEKARAPAFVLVHAQLLSTMDSTIHRQAAVEAMMAPSMADALHGADATISALTLTPSNIFKGMGENRLIMLLKDMLSDNSVTVGTGVKCSFAEAFMSMLKAATKRTSGYEHASCFILCDFLEEAFTIFSVFEESLNKKHGNLSHEEITPTFASTRNSHHQSHSLISFIDWSFWIEVSQMILNSNNTLAEMRLLSFVYNLWDLITADPARKEMLCKGWLLTEENFAKFFNNWSPMVRAYYMRLLCWRVCRRVGGPGSEHDDQIFHLVFERLNTVWSNYVWLKHKAEVEGREPPSKAPCLPEKGRHFMILGNQLHTAHQPGLFAGFDQFSNHLPGGTGGNLALRGTAAPLSIKADSARRKADSSHKKRWNLLGKVLSLTASPSTNNNNGESSGTLGKRNWDEQLEQARRETAASRAGTRTATGPPISPSYPPPPPPTKRGATAAHQSSDSGSSTGSSPVFDAARFVFRFHLQPHGPHFPPAQAPDHVLVPPHLPAPAEARLYFGCRPGSSSSAPPFDADMLLPVFRPRGESLLSQHGGAFHRGNTGSGAMSPESPVRMSLDWDFSAFSSEHGVSFGVDYDDGQQLQNFGELTIEDHYDDTSNSFVTVPGSGQDLNSGTPVGFPPSGAFLTTATYGGRALAEWELVVGECDNFVDRRRDEGVGSLGDVEVPRLSVEAVDNRGRPI